MTHDEARGHVIFGFLDFSKFMVTKAIYSIDSLDGNILYEIIDSITKRQ